MSDTVLFYAPPPARAPTILVVLPILNYISATASALFTGLGVIMWLSAAGVIDTFLSGDPDLAVGGMITTAHGVAYTAIALLCAAWIRGRRRRRLTRGLSAVLSLFLPFGTIAGLTTLVALSADSVRAAYPPPESQRDEHKPDAPRA